MQCKKKQKKNNLFCSTYELVMGSVIQLVDRNKSCVFVGCLQHLKFVIVKLSKYEDDT